MNLKTAACFKVNNNINVFSQVPAIFIFKNRKDLFAFCKYNFEQQSAFASFCFSDMYANWQKITRMQQRQKLLFKLASMFVYA